MKHTVYLGGPIAGLTFAGAGAWRDRAQELLAAHGIGVLYPVLNRNAKPDYVYNDQGYAHIPTLTPNAIVATDRWCVRTCSLVLMNLSGVSKASIGSMVEFGWADILGKLIVTVLDSSAEPDNPHNHQFVKQLSGVIVPTLEDAVDVIANTLPK